MGPTANVARLDAPEPSTRDESNGPEDFRIGASTPRVEDLRFVRGLGRYTDDIEAPDAAHMAVVRSPHAAARITGIDTSQALAVPGVLAVLTGADLESAGLGGLRTSVERTRRDGRPMAKPPYRILARDEVRFAGDAVAVVVADTRAIAHDAADLVQVDYEDLPSVTDAAEAVRPGAPAVWPDEVPDNVSFLFQQGDRAATDAAFARAEHVTSLDFRITRVSANPIEPRNAVAWYDPREDRYTLYAATQGPHKLRSELAEVTLKISPHQLRVVSPDVGGAFGMKNSPFPEYALCLWAARRVGRPVRWTATRGESFLSDYHARDNHTKVELALDRNGTFLGLRVRTVANLGAYLGFNTPHPSTNNLGGLAGTYRTPHIHAEVLGVFTHTQPMAPYRGAGRPEATYAIERVIDVAADELGIDRVELRRRNLIPPEAMPFKTGLIFTYDSGEFEKNMDRALATADWAGFPQRRAEAAARGLLRGIAVVNAIEIAGGPFRNPNEEAAEIRFDASGAMTVLLGTHNHGQGHETAFRQLAFSVLGVAPDGVRVVAGDTDLVVHGRGTFGSRTIMTGGTAFVRAADKIIARGKAIAAHMLEAGEGDIVFADGKFTIAGTDRGVRLEDVARASYTPGKLPPGMEYGLAALAVVAPPEATFPNGCHVCEVEIEEETGVTGIVNYVVVDDVGTVINPMLVKGQIHGGVAQGLGQALLENLVYEPGTGQMVSGSFMDYAMPRADDVPPMTVISSPVPTPNNPLGAKGAGEAGAVGSLPAVINAVVDALKPFGITHLDMPATPYRIWSAIRDAKAAAARDSGARG
ncbi:MAG TPA: xanthine dehydrogenase family protein molybdopterin-binding subunit [Beijerinckiaceae bacterium]|jgi:carbon-monoxide dehydrogenase large subunit